MKASSINQFYLRIGTACILVKLEHTHLKFARDLLLNLIFSSFGGFIDVKPSDEKPDFTVHISHSTLKAGAIRDKKNLTSNILQLKKRNEAYTSYTISIFDFQTIIGFILSTVLVRKKMILVHASAIKIGRKAYVFVGDPGAGKSTTIKLLIKKYTPLADDSVLLTMNNNVWYFYQTPYYEKESWIQRKSQGFPLGGVFFLNKSKDFKIEKEQERELIIEKILSQTISHTDSNRKTLALVFKFVMNYGNFYSLYFAKNSNKLINLFRDFSK